MDAVMTRQLCTRARQGSKTAREKLLCTHMGLVVHIAKYFYRPGAFMELGDLIQQGCLGLLHAIDKFDPARRSRGKLVQFATYAHYWICHSIRREIETHGRTIAVPIHRLNALKVPGSMPQGTPLPCAWSLEKSFEWLEDESETNNLARAVDLDDTSDHWTRAWEARHMVEELLRTLPQRTRAILRHRYGLGELGAPLTQKQTGRKLSVDGSRIGQLERSALYSLRDQAYRLALLA